MDIFWRKRGFYGLLEAFLMVLWVFYGDMVGKWTNEPCNGVDEVVNHFLVLTHFVKKMMKNTLKGIVDAKKEAKKDANHRVLF